VALLLGSGHDHVDLTAAAFVADQPLSPIGHGRFGAVALGHLGRVGLDLMLATKRDQPDAAAGVRLIVWCRDCQH
jgi:hypothetical protein